MAFTTDREDDYEIYVMSASGALQTNISESYSDDVGAAWTADGSRIVFTSDRDANYDIEVAGADGTGRHGLAATAADAWDPSWSPDGRRVAYTGDWNIRTVPAGGGRSRMLIGGRAYLWSPAYSPRGGLIAFAGDDGNDEIYVARADGSRVRRLTRNPTADYTPTWSPDARRIAFIRELSGVGAVWVMSAAGRGQHRIAGGPAYDPAWSPNGRLIAFSKESGEGDEARIYVVEPSGRGLRPVTGATGTYDDGPAWSPDGHWIAFARRDVDGSSALYVMRPDGTELKRVVDSRFQPYLPAWQPRR
jgi:TolB protein